MNSPLFPQITESTMNDDLRYKFISLPSHRKSELLSELHSTILLGIRALVLENLPEKLIPEFEVVANERGDDGILLFGSQHIIGFNNKFDVLKNTIQSAFLEELNNTILI